MFFALRLSRSVIHLCVFGVSFLPIRFTFNANTWTNKNHSTHWSWCCCCCFFRTFVFWVAICDARVLIPFGCWNYFLCRFLFVYVQKSIFRSFRYIYSNEGAGMLQTHLMLINVSCCCFFSHSSSSSSSLLLLSSSFQSTRERPGMMVLRTVAAAAFLLLMPCPHTCRCWQRWRPRWWCWWWCAFTCVSLANVKPKSHAHIT